MAKMVVELLGRAGRGQSRRHQRRRRRLIRQLTGRCAAVPTASAGFARAKDATADAAADAPISAAVGARPRASRRHRRPPAPPISMPAPETHDANGYAYADASTGALAPAALPPSTARRACRRASKATIRPSGTLNPPTGQRTMRADPRQLGTTTSQATGGTCDVSDEGREWQYPA